MNDEVSLYKKVCKVSLYKKDSEFQGVSSSHSDIYRIKLGFQAVWRQDPALDLYSVLPQEYHDIINSVVKEKRASAGKTAACGTLLSINKD